MTARISLDSYESPKYPKRAVAPSKKPSLNSTPPLNPAWK